MTYARTLFLAFVGASAIAACGGGVGSNAVSSQSEAGADVGTASGSSSGGSSSSGAAGSGSSSGSAADAGSIIPPGATPGTGMVTCGGATCNAPDVCCMTGRGGPMCSSITACNNAGGNDVYTCTSKANCAAPNVCCVTPGRGRNGDVSACQATCGMGADQVCLMDSECAAGQVCRNSGNATPTCQAPLIPPGATQGTGSIICGAATCTAPDVCCDTGGGFGGGGGLMCSSAVFDGGAQNGLSTCDSNGNNSYTCTGAANCAAPNVCCVTFGMGPANDVALCQATCSGANGANAQVCQTSAECTGGMVCRGARNVPGGITICQNPPMMPNPDAGTGSTSMDAAADRAATPETGSNTVTDATIDATRDAPGGG